MTKNDIIICFLKIYVLKYRFRLFVAGLFLFFVTIFSALFPIFFKFLIDAALEKNFHEIYNYGLLFTFFSLFLLFSMHMSNYNFEIIDQNVIKNLRIDLYKKIHSIEWLKFRKKTSGYFLQRILDDTERIKPLVFSKYLDFLFIFFKCFIIGYLIVKLSWLLTVVLLSIIPLYLVIYYIYLKKIPALVSKRQNSFSDLTTEIENGIEGTYLVRIKGSIQRFVSDLNQKYETYFKSYLSSYLANFWFSGIFGSFVMIGGQIALIWIGGYLMANDKISAGTLVAFVLYSSTVFEVLQFFLSFNSTVEPAKVSLNRIFEVLNMKDYYLPEDSKIDLTSLECKYDIEIRNLNFSYENQQIFQNFSLLVKKGIWCALVSESGMGKTTLLNILLKFYTVENNKVFIKGFDINSIPLKDLLSIVSVLEQEPFLFRKSVIENINIFEDKSFTAEEIKIYSEKISLKNDSSNEKTGSDLSGGEKKRASLIRLLLQKGEIIFLDEPTSYLDKENALNVMKLLKDEFGNKTVLIATHDPAVIEFCDQTINIRLSP